MNYVVEFWQIFILGKGCIFKIIFCFHLFSQLSSAVPSKQQQHPNAQHFFLLSRYMLTYVLNASGFIKSKEGMDYIDCVCWKLSKSLSW